MRVSLLYPTDNSERNPAFDRRIIYHLSLDRIFAHVCADVNSRERFLDIVADMTSDVHTIEYRRGVLTDFLELTDLHNRLNTLYKRFDELRISRGKAKKDGFRLGIDRTISTDSAKQILQMQALVLKRALLFVKSFDELLSQYVLKSDGLLAFREACRELCHGEAYKKLLSFCTKYENMSLNSVHDFYFEIDDNCRIEHYSLVDHRYIRISDTDAKKKGFGFLKKTGEQQYKCTRLYPGINEFYSNLTAAAFSELAGVLAAVSAQIFERFEGIYQELDFYSVAMRYVDVMSEKKLPYCFPAIGADKDTHVSELYDLYLSVSLPTADGVVPHEIEIKRGESGLILFGANGSGKTVFLRSLGCMQILMQAGLPIPAKSASLPVYAQIATQFSEAEKEFCSGNDAGRFEQEVRELAAMVTKLKRGSLVLLNETFQSTAYAEGSDGLCGILEHFGSLGITYVLVTHLKALEARAPDIGAAVKHTDVGYRMV